MLCLLILGCEITCTKAASFSSSNSEDECPKKTELECQKVNLYCCVKPSIEGQCCTEKEYFDQVKTQIYSFKFISVLWLKGSSFLQSDSHFKRFRMYLKVLRFLLVSFIL